MEKAINIYSIFVYNHSIDDCYCCPETYEYYYNIDEAYYKAKDLAEKLSKEKDLYEIDLLGGQYMDENGSICGKPDEISIFYSRK